MQLPAARLSTGDPQRRVERFDQAFGQLELGATRGADVEQRFAQRLQGAHLCLATGLGARLWRFGPAHGLQGCFGGSAHREQSEARAFAMILGTSG
ncbi:MAG: hypothetical protein AUH79_05930 [Betaproteobacteria bacterium 13_1_40CM_4_64_4]|nr:MAG: hypothetical protein AUH79_05930 [Betaproteobacteria bacterium 13_1_40CM_4_64_4]